MVIQPHILNLVVLVALLVAAPQSLIGEPALEDDDRSYGFHGAINFAEAMVAHNMDLVDSEVPQKLVPGLEQQRRNLEATRALVEIHAAQHPSDLHRAIAVAKQAGRFQATSLGLDWAEPVPLPGHELPSQALLDLAQRHNATLDPRQLHDIHGLDDEREPLRSALTRFINAFLALDTAARIAYQDADTQYLESLRDLVHDRGEPGFIEFPGEFNIPSRNGISQEAGIDLTLVLPTRNQFLAAIQDLYDARQAMKIPKLSACEPVQVPLVFSIDLSHCDNRYRTYHPLMLDLGGNDTYHNNAGGNTLGGGCSIIRSPAAALIDLGAGDDLYGDPQSPRFCGVNGGGRAGIGFLLDDGGDDTYRAADRATNGGGYLGGVGFLLDVRGDDTYRATGGGTNGGGSLGGIGLLVDLEGNDTYRAAHLGTNGGGELGGSGFLFDGTGNDVFTATQVGTNGGGSSGGNGFLASLSGDDRFIAERWGTNGGALLGGSGYLFDGGGNNTYVATIEGVNGGGTFGGVGFLLDAFGDDRYEADSCGVNGSGFAGCPSLADIGLGFLLDFGGQDEYIDNVFGQCWDCSMVPKGILGVQFDSDDPAGWLIP